MSFGLEQHAQIDHGYAATVHKSQGVAVERTHLLATRHLDRHAAYVAMSRHREQLTVHWATDNLGDRARLDTVMGRNWPKDFSADYDLSVDDPSAGGPSPAPPGGAQR